MFAIDKHGVPHTAWYTGNLWRRIPIMLKRRRNIRRFKRGARKLIKERRREEQSKAG